jgi:hypothetical protein
MTLSFRHLPPLHSSSISWAGLAGPFSSFSRLESITISSQPVTFKINALGERVGIERHFVWHD